MDIFHPTHKGKQAESDAVLSGSTLLLPIVSLGNVAQLAADLLIHSLSLERIGCLDSDCHIPVVSPVDYVEGQPRPRGAGLSTAIEVLRSRDGSLTLVQQRSPVIKSRKDAFVSALTRFIRAAEFKRVLVISGLDAGLMQHFDDPSPFRYLCSNESSLKQAIESLMRPLDPDSEKSDKQAAGRLPLMPASGITRRLLTSLLLGQSDSSSPSSSLDVTAVFMCVAEGDNRYDAHLLARCIDRILGLQSPEDSWREPVSWKVGLYGSEIGRSTEAAELYG